MSTIFFDSGYFRTNFPAFADTTKYPDATLQNYWTQGTAYVSDQSGGCFIGRMKLPQQKLALNLMTAHLTFLNNAILLGQNTAIVQQSTIDKISVTLVPPSVPNQWRFWLNQSPYGQQLLSLLEVASTGGFFFGGFPTSGALRR